MLSSVFIRYTKADRGDDMILMQLKKIDKSFGGSPVLNKAEIEIKTKDRIAIVGRNGAGKSTFLKIMTEEMSYDAGELFKIKELETGYLAQHIEIDGETSIWNFLLSVFSDLIKERDELREVAEKIEEDPLNEELIESYGKKVEAFEARGGYRFESDMKGVLTGLKFSEAMYDRPIKSLSGGQKTRLALGQLLLKQPDILFLDEPTNHLDIDTLTWLESYLVSYPGAIVIISHDRYFLDKIIDTVYEVAHQTTEKYIGSYSNYLKTKQANYEADLKRYLKQQEEIKEAEDFIQRNIARASTTKRAQSRRKALESMIRYEKPLGNLKSANFSFDLNKASGNDVLRLENYQFTYPNNDRATFKNVSFNIHRGDRIALIGDNGVGKTTLLKLIYQGQAGILGTNVEIGYYDQEQSDLIDKNTVLEELWREYPDVEEKKIRQTLGHFLFTQDDVLKRVAMLSGGEKARLALAKLMMLNANFLILDEPTNHLDLDSKEVLEAALIDFPGTILFVSHDRYFINKIADQVIELKPDQATSYLGDYDYFIAKKTETEEIKAFEEQESTANQLKLETQTDRKQVFEAQKKKQSQVRRITREIERIETEIEALEDTLSQIEEKMTDPEVFENHEALLELTEQQTSHQTNLKELYEKWEALQLNLE